MHEEIIDEWKQLSIDFDDDVEIELPDSQDDDADALELIHDSEL